MTKEAYSWWDFIGFEWREHLGGEHGWDIDSIFQGVKNEVIVAPLLFWYPLDSADLRFVEVNACKDKVCMNCSHWDHSGNWYKDMMKLCLHEYAGKKRSCVATEPLATCEHFQDNATGGGIADPKEDA